GLHHHRTAPPRQTQKGAMDVVPGLEARPEPARRPRSGSRDIGDAPAGACDVWSAERERHAATTSTASAGALMVTRSGGTPVTDTEPSIGRTGVGTGS